MNWRNWIWTFPYIVSGVFLGYGLPAIIVTRMQVEALHQRVDKLTVPPTATSSTFAVATAESRIPTGTATPYSLSNDTLTTGFVGERQWVRRPKENLLECVDDAGTIHGEVQKVFDLYFATEGDSQWLGKFRKEHGAIARVEQAIGPCKPEEK